MLEEYLTNEDGLMVSNSTWTYHIPTIDTIPESLNVRVLNSGDHKNRILSSKGTILERDFLNSFSTCFSRESSLWRNISSIKKCSINYFVDFGPNQHCNSQHIISKYQVDEYVNADDQSQRKFHKDLRHSKISWILRNLINLKNFLIAWHETVPIIWIVEPNMITFFSFW